MKIHIKILLASAACAVSSLPLSSAHAMAIDADSVCNSLTDTVAVAPTDTLLMASSAKDLTIDTQGRSTTITINKVDNGKDNFYCQVSQHGRVSAGASRSQLFYSNISDVLVTENNRGVGICFSDNLGSPQSYSFRFSDPANRSVKSYIGRRSSDIGITLSCKGKSSWEVISAGVSSGASMPLNATCSSVASMKGGFELSWLMALGISYSYRSSSVAVGLGFLWQKFNLADSHYFNKTDDGRIELAPYTDDMSKRSSRIKLFSLQLPVLYKIKFGQGALTVGPIMNFATSGNIKTRFRQDGRNISIKSNNIGARPVTLDAFMALSYSSVGVFARYSFFDKMRPSCDLNFKSISVGVIFFL